MKIKRKINKIKVVFTVWMIIHTGVIFSANPGDIVITEFNFQSAGNIYEYIEIFNTTSAPINLIDWGIEIDGNEFSIDSLLNINSLDYVVLVSRWGVFQDSTMKTYGSENDSSAFPNNCLSNCVIRRDDIYWLQFPGLSDESGVIKVIDDTDDTPIIIDEIIYNSADSGWSQIIGLANVGKSAEFILDPLTNSAYSLNDLGSNWRSSQHESEWLWLNETENETGSPLVANFITPSIYIEAITNSAGDSTIHEFNPDSTIIRPPSDGIPGGYASINLTGSADNASGTPVNLEFLFWEIMEDTVHVDSLSDSNLTWKPDSLQQDPDSAINTFTVSLVSRSYEKFFGKTDRTIYIKREFNLPPVVDSINDLVGGTIEIFDDDSLLLYGFVTDTELCPSLETSCTSENLYFPILDPPVYDNSSPFLWSSGSSESIDNLDSIRNLETVFRPESIISSGDISANSIRDTLEFQLKATDPFGESDSQIVTIIVHNKNQKPIIELDSTNISEIDLIAGYSFELVVAGNEIDLHEYDASGEQTEITLVAEIYDYDYDQTFTIYPQGNDCETGFENNYCVSGTTIKTYQNISNYNLVIPFMVDDGIPSPIEGFNSESTSDTSYLVIQNIKKVTHTVTFKDPIIFLDEYFHLPEDSTLIYPISFNINFKLDGDTTHSVNWDSLQWSFHKLDSENEQRIFAYKTDDGFKIDSLSNNFNGQTGLKVFVTDNDNTAPTLSDSIIINIPIFIDQRNDTSKHFNLYHDIKSYSINESTIESIRGVRYFRLAQLSSNNNASNPTSEKLRFEWEKNDYLDIDTDTEINKDAVQKIFYRLELIDTLTHVVSILKDSLLHNNFSEFENIGAEIDFQGVKFPFYYDSLGYSSQLEKKTIDINGLSNYKWRVVAQNYPDDSSIDDPPRTCSGWENTDFRIDLIQPKVTKLDIILNEMYPGFYDLLWSSTEAFLTDSTFLSIKEETNQFSAISMLNPRRVTDNLFHFTGIIPTSLVSVSITFDLQIRDNAMNSGERIDEVSYIKVSPDTASLLISPSNNVTISLPQYSVSEPVHIIITEDNSNLASRESDSEFYQITPTIHFYPKELILNKPGSIYFDISDYLSSEYEPWQLTICEIIDLEFISLTTNISEGMLTASIDKLGDYAVFVNSTIEKPLPIKFKLIRNFPNPFNPSTTIPIELPEESYVEVVIYNILGEKIVVLFKGVKPPGYHSIHWSGKNQFGKSVSSGIYFVSVHFGQKFHHQKMMLLK